MIATSHFDSTTASDDPCTYDGTSSTCRLIDLPSIREVVVSIEIDPFADPMDSMTPEEKFAYLGELLRELREKIKHMARAAIGLLSIMPVEPFRVVAFYRRICTPLVPTQHYKIHNHPVRFVREGL